MALNLLNDKALNDYLIDVVYQGDNIPKQQSYSGEFESPDYVEQHRDEIVKGILIQYIKLRLRNYVLTLANEPAFEMVDKNRTDLPGWTERTFARGEDIYEFNGAKMSQELRDEITMIRDFLYDEAGQYVDKVVRIARETKKKPKIRYDYLKTSNEYDTFEKALAAAEHWHENMAVELEKRNRAHDLLKKSLNGVEHVMDLGDGLSAFKLMSPEALDFESDYMGHCVGQGYYDTGVQNGKIQIYSIRDERGEPHATLEIRDGAVIQCKGKANKRPIKKYIPAIQQFVLQQKFRIQNDAKNIGIINIDRKNYSVYNLPKYMEVKGDLDIGSYDLEELPDLSNWIVHGNFSCNHNQLTNLRGAPQNVGGFFDCSHNQLTSLEGAPQIINDVFSCDFNQLTNLNGAPQTVGSFDCRYNQLTSLEGAPQTVGNNFDCGHNQLTNLNGAPQSIVGNFDCGYNQLTNLNGAPQTVGGRFDCSYNKLTNLNGAPQSIVGNFDCGYNQLTNLNGVPQSVGSFDCAYNQLTNLNGAPQRVDGTFYCKNNQLTSLEGAPQYVGGGFICNHNLLTSLEGAPQHVENMFFCENNLLTSLKGAPQYVGERFFCDHNQLTSLEGAPQSVNDHFDCSNNQLTSLNGAPQTVGGRFGCKSNQLTNLNGAPQNVGGDFDCRDNKLTSLNGAPQTVGGDFYCDPELREELEQMKSERLNRDESTTQPDKVFSFKAAIKKMKKKLSEKFHISDVHDYE